MLLANQAGSAPTALILSSNLATTGAGAKTFTLGGDSSDTFANQIQGVIRNATDATVTSLAKVGTNTWLYSPAVNNYVAADITSLTYAAGANVNTYTLSADAAASGVRLGQIASPGGIVTAINGSVITVSNTTGGTAITAGTAITFSAITNASQFTGGVTVSGGTMQFRATAASGVGSDLLGAAAALTFNNDPLRANGFAGGTFEYLGLTGGGAITEALGALTATAGAGIVKITPTSGATALTFASLVTVSNGTGINFTGTGTSTITGVATSTATTLPGNGHFYINGSDFARSNAGAMVVPVYGTDTGFVNAVAGAATLTAANHNFVTGAITAQTALTVSSLKLTTNNLTLTGLLTVNVGANTSGGILQTGGAATISGTGVTTAGSGDLVIRVDGSGDQLTLSAPVTATTTGGITKNGAGTLILNAVNAETTGGPVTVNEGKLQLMGATTTLGAANIGLTLRQGTTFAMNGVSLSSVGALTSAGTITNTSAALSTLNVGNSNTTGLVSGIIQDGTGLIALTKSGTGTLSLTGLNTFTQPLTLTGGTIAVTTLANIGSPSGIGAGIGTNDASNAASLVFASGTSGTIQYTGSNAAIFQATQTSSPSRAVPQARLIPPAPLVTTSSPRVWPITRRSFSTVRVPSSTRALAPPPLVCAVPRRVTTNSTRNSPTPTSPSPRATLACGF